MKISDLKTSLGEYAEFRDVDGNIISGYVDDFERASDSEIGKETITIENADGMPIMYELDLLEQV